MVLTKEEEYTSGEEEEDEDDDSSSEVAAIATTLSTTSSLFDSPNENQPKNINCLMARASEVSSSIPPITEPNYDMMNDATSLKIKEELVAFDSFMTNLQGDYKKHFGALMDQLAMANDRIEKMGQIERDDANEIASLNNALEEEQETRAALEE